MQDKKGKEHGQLVHFINYYSESTFLPSSLDYLHDELSTIKSIDMSSTLKKIAEEKKFENNYIIFENGLIMKIIDNTIDLIKSLEVIVGIFSSLFEDPVDYAEKVHTSQK